MRKNRFALGLYQGTTSVVPTNAAHFFRRASARDEISPPFLSFIAPLQLKQIPQRLKPWTRRQFAARLKPCPFKATVQ
jgi:hypothetical protein